MQTTLVPAAGAAVVECPLDLLGRTISSAYHRPHTRIRERDGGGHVERSADWMDQASRDLAHAKQDLATGFYEWACFSAQQSAEKAAKAVLQKAGAEAWGHSVADLLSAVASTRQIPGELLDLARELDKAYIPARYPNAHPAGSPGSAYTRGEAQRMTAHAERIVGVCQGLLATL